MALGSHFLHRRMVDVFSRDTKLPVQLHCFSLFQSGRKNPPAIREFPLVIKSCFRAASRGNPESSTGSHEASQCIGNWRTEPRNISQDHHAVILQQVILTQVRRRDHVDLDQGRVLLGRNFRLPWFPLILVRRGRQVDRRGEGIDSICFSVDDMDHTQAELATHGIEFSSLEEFRKMTPETPEAESIMPRFLRHVLDE